MSDIEMREGFRDDYTEFAELAAKNFKDNPHQTSFTDGVIETGKLIAMRWGGDADCVLVFRIDDKIVNFCNVIDLEPLEGMTHLQDYLKQTK